MKRRPVEELGGDDAKGMFQRLFIESWERLSSKANLAV